MAGDNDKALESYNRDAETLAQAYNALSSTDVLPGLAARLPDAAGKTLWALDVACGSGRDARWLAEQGFHVVACDGAGEMIRLAQEKQAHENITYLVDRMPRLENIRAAGRRFDVILISAALMHLGRPERKEMFDTLCGVANPGALVYITLRNGPAPQGRPMHDVGADELRKLAEDAGKRFVAAENMPDCQNRADVSWSHVTLKM